MIKAARVADRSKQDERLLPGEYGNERGSGETFARPPKGASVSLKGREVVTFPDTGLVTVIGEIDNGDWKGRLKDGFWLDEGEKLPGEE